MQVLSVFRRSLSREDFCANFDKLRIHWHNIRICNKSYGFARLSVVERKRILSPLVHKEISFTRRAAEQNLNRINRAGIRLRNAYNLLILGKREVEEFRRKFRGFIAHGETAAGMPVECHGIFK